MPSPNLFMNPAHLKNSMAAAGRRERKDAEPSIEQMQREVDRLAEHGAMHAARELALEVERLRRRRG